MGAIFRTIVLLLLDLVSFHRFSHFQNVFVPFFMMPSRYNSVRSIFEEAQRGIQHHKKLLTELKKHHDSSSQDEFQESFLWHLKHAMVVFNREPAVERVIDFAAKYATLKDHRTSETRKVKDSVELLSELLNIKTRA